MSYCVNCGVELEAAQKNCPLCHVKVINPAQPQPSGESKTFPTQKDEFKRKDRYFWIKFISILLAAPIITGVLSNLLYDKKLTWSIYVIAGVFILWVFATSPMYFKQFDYKKMFLIDMPALLIGLLVIEVTAPNPGWYTVIALPLVTYVFAALFMIIYLLKIQMLSVLGFAAALLIATALMMPGLEALIDLYTTQHVLLFWSWFVTAPCLSAAMLLMLLNKNKLFKQELHKRLHF